MRRTKERGFTLVELIIVIIILGILAALGIPQFIDSTKDAEESTLSGDVAVLRNAIALYYHQHSATYPGAVKVDGTGTATAAADNPVAFVDQLTKYTDKDGKVSAALDRANYPYGPYLVNGMIVNPTDSASTSVVLDSTAAIAAGDVTAAGGWLFNKQTGEVRPNNTTYLTY